MLAPKPKKEKSSQTIRDYKRIQHRVKMHAEKIDFVSSYIDRYFGTHVTIAILTTLAKITMEKYNLTLDRLERRNRIALLCWFARNWGFVYPILKDKDFRSNLMKIFCQLNSTFRPQEFPTIPNLQGSYIDPSDLSFLLNYH
ncbi:hypothetical protein TVAG_336140 [Trichomonas vaginalis G3]|uniref:Uncharacterized protein n=1 Tax=Trichomonas vaginalis (strain ATCC PRA-98 / G3) TaxID=412133 RepID=A2FNA0_TRIV3|nr:hypothetical protein TVAGG3_0795570 [Trichomonas vaginalis G3]EAX93628.1 hypothetical protein TVAG_336140 [Trichomonas vaginalis G3]KAI5496141.1 hypothetical protein TVAGG3_0795570 [Trichomonas vaginalis G3]|eukprot:XP_001306558.1 hypothetical protein [Trichomonas vaginalis G3]